MKKSKKKIPSQEQIDAEIKWLTENKLKVRKISAFGVNNHDSIDAAIEVLKNKLTDQQIDDRSWFEDEEPDESKWSPDDNFIARDAFNWLNGDELEPPSFGWKPLVQK